MVQLSGCRRGNYDSFTDGQGLMYTWTTFGPKRKLVAVKRPSLDEIQRLAIARYFMRISQPLVYQAKKTDPKFEETVEKWKYMTLERRVFGFCHKPSSEKLRRLRENHNPDSLGDGEYDFEGALLFHGLSFETVVSLTRGGSDKENNILLEGIEDTQIWQRRHWKAQYVRDMISDIAAEVLAMDRMVTQSVAAITPQPMYTICLESSRYSLRNHEWGNVCRGLLTMMKLTAEKPDLRVSSTFPCGSTAVWMLGFLSIINYHKNECDVLKDFMKKTQYLFKSYPPWWGVQFAVWLLQKGFVQEAQELLEENSLENLASARRIKLNLPRSKDCKKEMTLFLFSLIQAMFVYCSWKLEDMELNDEGEDHISFMSRDSLRRKGEAALRAYQTVYEKWQIVEAEPMCFLPPFVELLIEFRSVTRARDIIKEIYDHHDGNMFVEKFYVQFLEENAGSCGIPADRIAHLRARVEGKFTFTASRKVYFKGKRQIMSFKESRKNPAAMAHFKKISNPGFSW